MKVFIQDTDGHHKTRCVHEDAYTLEMRTERIDKTGHVTVSKNVSKNKGPTILPKNDHVFRFGIEARGLAYARVLALES